MTTVMKQIQMAEYGPSDVLQVIETNTPSPKAGELLLRNRAAGVNYSDILRRKNTYFMPTPLPYVLGVEVVGEVIGRGADVSSEAFPDSTRVLAILPYGGGYAEYAVAPAQYCVPLPPNLDDKAATAIFVQGTTAHLLTHRVARDISGKTVLIHAASGGVGSLLVQFCRQAGARVIAASSSDAKLQYASELGADLQVNYARPNWTQTLIEQNQGERVDCIFEMVGGSVFEDCIDALKPGGSIITYGAASGERGCIHSERFVDENQHLLSFNLAYHMQHQFEDWQQSLGAVIELMASEQLRIRTEHTFPLAEAAAAHAAVEARATAGKVVLLV